MRAEKRCAVSLRSKDSDREEDRERLFRLHGCLSFQGLRGKEQTALVVGFLLGDASYSELTAGTEPGTAHLAASLFQRQRQSGGTVHTVGRARATKLERAPGQRSSTRKETSSCLLFLFTELLRLSGARNQHNKSVLRYLPDSVCLRHLGLVWSPSSGPLRGRLRTPEGG